MGTLLNIAAYDDVFSARTTPDEWARIVAFRNYPNFLDGAARHDGVMQPFFAHNFILNKVVAEIWRFQMLVLILYLDEKRDPIDPRSGLTLANLQKLCADLKLASPGRVAGYLNIMKVGGYLSRAPSDLDSRIIHLRPTPHFLGVVEVWNGNIFECIDAAHPSGGLTALQAKYSGLGRGMRTSGAEGLLAGWQAMEPFPEVLHFASVDGGFMLMERIVADAMRDPGKIDIRSVKINIGLIGNQFGGSRSNLRRLLDGAYEMGLLEVPPAGGAKVVFTPQMVCAFLTFLASFLGYFEKHTAIALARIEAA